MNGRQSRGKISVLKTAIIAVALVMLIAGIFLIVTNRSSKLISSDGNSSGDETAGRSAVFEPHRPSTEYSYTVDHDDPFSAVVPIRNYSGVVLNTDSYIDSTTSAYNITSVGEKFYLTDGRRTVIYNGETLYIRTSLYELKQKTDKASLSSELGVISFDELVERVNDRSGEAVVSVDGKTIYVTFDDGKTREEYSVDAVNGVITKYSAFRDGVRIRSYMLLEVTPITNEILNENYFKIPD